jgi:hypothetical protein
MGYVIRDENGMYAPKFLLTDEGWSYVCFTGMTTGLSGYLNKRKAETEITKLQNLCKKYGFNKRFNIGYINFEKIKDGKMEIDNIISNKNVINL